MSEDHPMPAERPTPVATPEVIKPPLSLKDVQHDFWLSFRFSQGNMAANQLQHRLLRGVSRLYPHEEFEAIYAEIMGNEFREVCSTMQIPHKHIKDRPDDQMVDIYKLHFDKNFKPAMVNQYKEPKEIDDITLEGILDDMIVTDERYQQIERPGKDPKIDDVHESFVKSFILEGRRSSSARYDELFRRVKEYIPRARGVTQAKLVRLEIQWERNHAGQSFLPPDAEEKTD